MRCPKCTSIEDKVVDSRISKEGNTIRRRRECAECGHRYTTVEILVRDGIVVIKRDGRREDFDREKLVRAIRHACHKRPIDAEQIAARAAAQRTYTQHACTAYSHSDSDSG